jgi:hypothetical protein
MVRTICAVIAVFCAGLFIDPAVSRGQDQPPLIPPPPLPAEASGTPVLPKTLQVPQTGQPQPQQVLQPPPGEFVVPPPPPVQLSIAEPLIFRPENRPGLFAVLDIDIFRPSIGGDLTAEVPVGKGHHVVSLPYADLDWTGSPRIELGYRFGDIGSVAAAYRSVVSQGSANVDGFDPAGPAFLRTRLNLNAVDLMYISPEYKLDTYWDLQWDAGLRIGAVYFDSQLTGEVLSESASNNFVGAGPFAGVDIRHYFADAPGFSAFGHVESGVLIGNDTQSYGQSVAFGGKSVGGATRFSETEGAPMFDFQLGVSYSPPQNARWLRLSFGYEFQEWWNVGSAGGNRGNVEFQGFFFRGEYHY